MILLVSNNRVAIARATAPVPHATFSMCIFCGNEIQRDVASAIVVNMSRTDSRFWLFTAFEDKPNSFGISKYLKITKLTKFQIFDYE